MTKFKKLTRLIIFWFACLYEDNSILRNKDNDFF